MNGGAFGSRRKPVHPATNADYRSVWDKHVKHAGNRRMRLSRVPTTLRRHEGRPARTMEWNTGWGVLICRAVSAVDSCQTFLPIGPIASLVVSVRGDPEIGQGVPDPCVSPGWVLVCDAVSHPGPPGLIAGGLRKRFDGHGPKRRAVSVRM